MMDGFLLNNSILAWKVGRLPMMSIACSQKGACVGSFQQHWSEGMWQGMEVMQSNCSSRY